MAKAESVLILLISNPAIQLSCIAINIFKFQAKSFFLFFFFAEEQRYINVTVIRIALSVSVSLSLLSNFYLLCIMSAGCPSRGTTLQVYSSRPPLVSQSRLSTISHKLKKRLCRIIHEVNSLSNQNYTSLLDHPCGNCPTAFKVFAGASTG